MHQPAIIFLHIHVSSTLSFFSATALTKLHDHRASPVNATSPLLLDPAVTELYNPQSRKYGLVSFSLDMFLHFRHLLCFRNFLSVAVISVTAWPCLLTTFSPFTLSLSHYLNLYNTSYKEQEISLPHSVAV